jgi:hypothetical protein
MKLAIQMIIGVVLGVISLWSVFEALVPPFEHSSLISIPVGYANSAFQIISNLQVMIIISLFLCVSAIFIRLHAFSSYFLGTIFGFIMWPAFAVAWVIAPAVFGFSYLLYLALSWLVTHILGPLVVFVLTILSWLWRHTFGLLFQFLEWIYINSIKPVLVFVWGFIVAIALFLWSMLEPIADFIGAIFSWCFSALGTIFAWILQPFFWLFGFIFEHGGSIILWVAILTLSVGTGLSLIRSIFASVYESPNEECFLAQGVNCGIALFVSAVSFVCVDRYLSLPASVTDLLAISALVIAWLRFAADAIQNRKVRISKRVTMDHAKERFTKFTETSKMEIVLAVALAPLLIVYALFHNFLPTPES